MENKITNYRGDCWKGIKDVRLRLKMAGAGQTISFICEKDQVDRILRVIIYNDGEVMDKISKPDGVSMTVRKT